MPYKSKEARNANLAIWREKNREKLRDYSTAYRKENKEDIKEKTDVWRSNNREDINNKSRKWVKNNPEVRAASVKKYTQSNPEKKSNNAHRRRAKLKGAGSFIVSNKFMKRLYLSACRFCGADKDIQADHIIPISKGGRHSEGNLQPLCGPCNRSKNDKLWIKFIKDKQVSVV